MKPSTAWILLATCVVLLHCLALCEAKGKPFVPRAYDKPLRRADGEATSTADEAPAEGALDGPPLPNATNSMTRRFFAPTRQSVAGRYVFYFWKGCDAHSEEVEAFVTRLIQDLGLPEISIPIIGGNESDSNEPGLYWVTMGTRKGLVLQLPPGSNKGQEAIDIIGEYDIVEYIEQCQSYRLSVVQNDAPWGLDRIDQRSGSLNDRFEYEATGSGVDIYIMDTGIRLSHTEFGGRAQFGANTVGGTNDDCNGHGTHVAGIAGGQTFGVAKGATLVSVKVLNCNGAGDTATILNGLNWILTNHNPSRPSIASLSLGGEASQTVDIAVGNLITAGITVVVAAGNEDEDACNFSPARVSNAITVGATTASDKRASYSNYGTCLDVFAPGSSIVSAWITSNTATAVISGTSMATPFASGVVAQFLEENADATPAQASSALVDSATTNRLSGIGSGSPNRLLFTPITLGPITDYSCVEPVCETHEGSLTEAGSVVPSESDYVYEPDEQYYYVNQEDAASGYHRGILQPANPEDADSLDFDMALLMWREDANAWQTVAIAANDGPYESIT